MYNLSFYAYSVILAFLSSVPIGLMFLLFGDSGKGNKPQKLSLIKLVNLLQSAKDEKAVGKLADTFIKNFSSMDESDKSYTQWVDAITKFFANKNLSKDKRNELAKALEGNNRLSKAIKEIIK